MSEEKQEAVEQTCPLVGKPCLKQGCTFYLAMLDAEGKVVRSECAMLFSLSIAKEHAQLTAQLAQALGRVAQFRGGHRG